MEFNIQKFAKVLKGIFPGDSAVFSFEDTLEIFKYYFEAYEEHTGKVHPPINSRQIKRVISDMPVIFDCGCGRELGVDPEDYPAMIDKYFNTNYKKCDYNINHFFSGRIREIKYFEVCL